VITDATTARGVWSKGSAKVHLSELARRPLALLNQRSIRLSARWRAGVLNTEADALSRLLPGGPPRRSTNDPNNYMLLPEVFRAACRKLWYSPRVDMFASKLNQQLPRFWTRFPEEEAEAHDAFTQRWTPGSFLYGNPPWNLIPEILSRIRSEKGRLMLVFPVWRGASWWPGLISMATSFYLLPARALYRNERGEIMPAPRWRSAAAVLDCSSRPSTRTPCWQRGTSASRSA
jgi:hypothetical protein